MSWSVSFVAADKNDAKSKMEAAGEQVPEVVRKLVADAVDALPASDMEGYDAISVSTYGHFRAEDHGPGTSNLQVSVQHCENTTAKQ